MAKKQKATAAPLWDKNGDPLNDAAVMADIKRYLMPKESAQPKKTAKVKKGQKKEKPAETPRWAENGDPINDAAFVADIKRYLGGQ